MLDLKYFQEVVALPPHEQDAPRKLPLEHELLEFKLAIAGS
jgi:hypothetical protein